MELHTDSAVKLFSICEVSVCDSALILQYSFANHLKDLLVERQSISEHNDN